MLARHGYGVLVYDARGRGESDGTENNYGWDWDKDVAGALALSTGADVLIDVAAHGDDVKAWSPTARLPPPSRTAGGSVATCSAARPHG
jgi:hypothetical protein